MGKTRYAVAGAGSRGLGMFARPLVEDFSEQAELVALLDSNPRRLEYARQSLGLELLTFTDFDEMLTRAEPDAVIVATKDSTHAEFMVKSLQAGRRAICEKPLCVSAEQCRDIWSAAQESPAQGIVTHNMRYGPLASEMKRRVMEGQVGTLLRMHFEEHLDRVHGADYFRRWHRRKENSGGLLIHKASHHFDFLNWVAEALPVEAYAQGALRVYGRNGPFRSQRCHGCPHAERCDYYVDYYGNERMRRMYFEEAEAADGYHRDGCVFAEEVDIEDEVAAVIRYQNGVLCSYTLCAHAPYEGHNIQLEGPLGRLEYVSVSDTGWLPGTKKFSQSPKPTGQSLWFYSPDGRSEKIEVPPVEGGHGGSDSLLRQDLFGEPRPDPLRRQAPLWEGLQAVLVGAACNESIATGKPVDVQGLLKTQAG